MIGPSPAVGKVTLAELRKEASRVGAEDLDEYRFCGVNIFRAEYVKVHSASRNKTRRRLLKLLRALPDGALKEG